ncbi:hypothetical protein [Pseudomonas sp. Irchel 3E13]|jgi:hypothetical protein|uniref:hypothetical protein n=1 Tax=Pseudomonas sp. Irchel 3E13 TaxID=2008975 RepID=UPI001357B285|nr:hypothetical protein [Pseudomonas sp. Irchel 3E13]
MHLVAITRSHGRRQTEQHRCPCRPIRWQASYHSVQLTTQTPKTTTYRKLGHPWNDATTLTQPGICRQALTLRGSGGTETSTVNTTKNKMDSGTL